MTVGLLGTRREVLPVAGVLLYAAAASLTTPLTPMASVAVLVPAVTVLVLAGARNTRPHAGRIRGHLSRTALAWAVVVALTAVWDLLAWLAQPAYNVASASHPTLSLLLDPLTGSPLPRLVLWCCWLYVGYRLVRR